MGHTDEITQLLFEENCVYSSSNDNSIRIWNTETNSCDAEYKLPGGVKTFHIQD